MGATSQGYKATSGNWKAYKNATGTVTSTGKSAESHAERLAYTGFGNIQDNPLLLVQDAFPCFDKCHAFFKNLSKAGKSVIIKVTADNTYDAASYAADGLITKPYAFPYYIYYHGGAATISNASPPVSPGGFPVHPAPMAV